VRWLLASAAPPGTVSPSAPGGAAFKPDADGVIHSQGGVLPPPVAGKSVNVKVRNGRVFYKPPGAKKFVELKDPVQVPLGTEFDTLKGNVSLTSAADGKGAVQNAWFYSGIFKVTQTKGAKPVVVLTLAGTLKCPKTAKATARAAAKATKKKKPARHLWGDGKGAFETKGDNAAAAVRGTKWFVEDTCTTTLVKVARGVVAVHDLVTGKTISVKAGHSYTARRRP
jgi:hypothetical protein